VKQFRNKVAARKATVGLVRKINSQDLRVKSTTMTLSQFAQHYRQRELRPDNQEKNYSTKAGYNCYLKKWIVPRWGEHTLPSIRASEVEEWLKYLELAQATRSRPEALAERDSRTMSEFFREAFRSYHPQQARIAFANSRNSGYTELDVQRTYPRGPF
jgi:hypothetical protein